MEFSDRHAVRARVWLLNIGPTTKNESGTNERLCLSLQYIVTDGYRVHVFRFVVFKIVYYDSVALILNKMEVAA